MTLLIDDRERKIFKFFPNAQIAHLEVGDILYKDVCIERKSIGDFIGSIKKGNLFAQAMNMRNNYTRSYILVEGDLRNISSYIYFKFPNANMTIEQVRGVISWIMTEYNIPVLLCSTRKQFVEMVNSIIKQVDKEDGSKHIVVDKIVKCNADPKLQILMCIPGIGKKKAIKILDHYKSYKNIKVYERPKGIGEKDINKIVEFLEL